MTERQPARAGRWWVLAALIVLTSGCASSRVRDGGYEPGQETRRIPLSTEFGMASVRVDGEPALVIGVFKDERTKVIIQKVRIPVTVTEGRSWQWHPEFFALPLAPVQTVVGLSGGALLATGCAVTYPVRAVIGTAGGAALPIAGRVFYVVRVPVGLTGHAFLLVLNPLVKQGAAGAAALLEVVLLAPAFADGLLPLEEPEKGVPWLTGIWPRQPSPKYVLETLTLLVNLDLMTIGSIAYRSDGAELPAESRYRPYEPVTLPQLFSNLSTKWAKAWKDTWAFTWDFSPATAEKCDAASTSCWTWAWDLDDHVRLFGLNTAEPGRKSLFSSCVDFALDYGRYSWSPLLPDGKWREVRRTHGPPVPDGQPYEEVRTERIPCAIRLPISGNVRAKRADAPQVTIGPAMVKPLSTGVRVDLGEVLSRFCHDDQLVVAVEARLETEPDKVRAHECELRVSDFRKAGGPVVTWVEPAAGGTGPHRMPQQAVNVSVVLRGDTGDAPIGSWQIKQDGVLRGVGMAAPGKNLGRTVVAVPVGGEIQLPAPGQNTTVQVIVDDVQGNTTTSTVTLVR